MKVEIVKEVKRSDGLWRFACGDVFSFYSYLSSSFLSRFQMTENCVLCLLQPNVVTVDWVAVFGKAGYEVAITTDHRPNYIYDSYHAIITATDQATIECIIRSERKNTKICNKKGSFWESSPVTITTASPITYDSCHTVITATNRSVTSASKCPIISSSFCKFDFNMIVDFPVSMTTLPSFKFVSLKIMDNGS